MLWNHIAQLYFSDLDQGLHQLARLTADHINLNSYSKVKVSLAAQVFFVSFYLCADAKTIISTVSGQQNILFPSVPVSKC